MISFLRRSIPNFKDAEETELASKNKRGSSATSATSSQDEGIHSTGEKEEDDINDEDLTDNKIATEDENGNNEEEDDEGRGSFIGGKLTDDEAEEPGYIGDAEDTPITSALGNNESDEETLKNEESEVELEGTENEVEESTEDGPGEDATAVESENAPEDDESDKPNVEETEEAESESEEPENEVQAEPDMEETENEVETFTAEDDPDVEETENEVEAFTAEDEAVVEQEEDEEPAVEDQDTEQEATTEYEPETEDKVEEYQEEAMEVDESALEAIEEAAEPDAEAEESNPPALEVPSISIIESEGDKSDISEEPAIAQLPGTKTRKKKEIIDMSKVTANRKPLYTRVAMPISSKKENTNFKPQLKSKTDFHRQKTFRLKRKPPNINRENKENELPPLKNVYRRTSESSNAVSSAGNAGTEFLNPHMDHSLKRPIAPHYRLKTSELNNRSPRSNIKGPLGTEVYVPEEEKIYVYSYSSIPRVLHAKRMNQRKFSTQFSNDIDPNSSLRLKFRNARLIRGSTFGKDGMPQWDPYFAYARCLSRNDFQFYETEEVRQRREEFRKQLRERARVRRKVNGTSSLYQTNNNLHPKEQQHNASSILEGSEGTASYGTTPRYRKQRASISVATQVSEGERSSQLTTARSPETEVIKALVANTLREAAMEVAAEAEENREKMESIAATRLSSFGTDNPTEDTTAEEPEPMEDDAKEEECKEEDEVHIDEEAATVAAVGGDEEAEEDEGGGEDAEADEENENEAEGNVEGDADGEAEEESQANAEEETAENEEDAVEDTEEAEGDAVTEINNDTDEETEENDQEEKEEKSDEEKDADES